MKRILITNLGHDVHACIDGEPRKRGCGPTIQSAIGDLIMSWAAEFGIEVTRSSPISKSAPTDRRDLDTGEDLIK